MPGLIIEDDGGDMGGSLDLALMKTGPLADDQKDEPSCYSLRRECCKGRSANIYQSDYRNRNPKQSSAISIVTDPLLNINQKLYRPPPDQSFVRRTFNTMSPQNLCHLLRQAVDKSPQNGVLVYDSVGTEHETTFLTYKGLLECVETRSAQLRERFDLKNKVVALYFNDHLDGILWFWFVVAAGGVPCILPPLPKDDIQRGTYVVGLQKVLGNPLYIIADTLSYEFRNIEGIRIILSNRFNANKHEAADYNTLPGDIKLQNDLAVLMLTSGSTGTPKAVCLEHGQILRSLEGKSSHHQTSESDVFLNWTGLDHVANLTEIHLHAMSLGAQQIHVPSAHFVASPTTFLSKISKHRVSYTFAPNFFLASLVCALEKRTERHRKCDTHNYHLSALRALISGGEANMVHTCHKLTALLQPFSAPKIFVRPGFGMTETCAGSIYNSEDCPAYDVTHKLEFANLGTPIPGVQMRIVRENGSQADVNEVGLLQVTGTVIFKKYFNNPEATRASFSSDGWFKTGDLGAIDSNGRLRLTGRDKDVVIINGVNYNLQAIEYSIEDAHISGIVPSFTVVFAHRPTGSETESLCVIYLPSYEGDDLKAQVDTATGISKAIIIYSGIRPYKIIPLEASLLRKSSLGKLSRPKIRAAFEAGVYRDHQEKCDRMIRGYNQAMLHPASTETEKIILDAYRRCMSDSTLLIGASSNMFDIGISSIQVLHLRLGIQRAFRNVQIPVSMLFAHPIVHDLARAIEDLQMEKTYDPLVILQPNGTKTPIFFIHPGIGEVLIFMNISRYFPDRPIYALRARGFDGEEYFRSMDEMIICYHQAIKRRQPKGPYAVAGYSFGSIFAFEIAKIMERSGDEIRFLATIDQPPHFKNRARGYDWYETILTLSFFLGFLEESYVYGVLPEMKKKSQNEVLDHIFELAAPAKVLEMGMSREKLDNWANLALQMKLIACDYDPSGLVSTMDIFYTGPLIGIVKAKTMEEWFNDYISKWKDFVEEATFHVVGGTHRTMISPPHLAGFVKELKGTLESRGL